MTTNELSNPVSPLSIALFRGNPFTYILELPEGYPLPAEVKIRTYQDSDFGKPVDSAVEGTITRSNRLLTIQYLSTAKLPVRGTVKIYFDNVVVWAGPLTSTYSTSSVPIVQHDLVLLLMQDDKPVLVTTPALSEELEAPDYLSIYELFKQA